MSDINLSKAVRSNLLSLQNTATMMAKTQERLATGLKVNSAMDNPTNFFTASSLKSRAGDLGLLMDSVSNAVQTLSAADKGISAITKLVESAQATARQALQTGATTTVTNAATITGNLDFSNDTTAVASGGTALTGANDADTVFAAGETLTISIDGTDYVFEAFDGEAAAYNGTNIGIDVRSDAGNEVSIADALDAIETALRTESGIADATVGLNGANEVEITLGTNLTASLGITDGSTGFDLTNDTYSGTSAAVQGLSGDVSVTVNGNTSTVSLDNLDTSADLAAAFNAVAGLDAEIDDNGNLVLTATNNQASVTLTDGTGTVASLGTNFTSGTAINSTTATEPNAKRAELVEQYNELLSQIDDLAKDASFNGVNLLNGDELQVIFNEDGSSKLDITGVTFDAAGLGLTALGTTAFDANDDINTILTDLKSGIETLRTQASKFGSNLSVVETRQNFTKDMINVLETGSANLTLADTNEEAANLLALQTRQQLASTALSMASQADQAVLRLF